MKRCKGGEREGREKRVGREGQGRMGEVGGEWKQKEQEQQELRFRKAREKKRNMVEKRKCEEKREWSTHNVRRTTIIRSIGTD